MAFKMKSGSPMKRNFGVGESPAKQKSPVKQKLNENPHAITSDMYWRGRPKKETYSHDKSGGVVTRHEDKWYEENPYMSPTAEEQDIFIGKDIEATDQQYYPPQEGFMLDERGNPQRWTVSATGKHISQQEDMGGNQFNNPAYINYAKRLEREKEMREAESKDKPIVWSNK